MVDISEIAMSLMRRIQEEKEVEREKKKVKYPQFLGVENNKEVWANRAGNSWFRNIGEGAGTRWDKVSNETQKNDMRSLTIWGQLGTSEGDAWDLGSVTVARKIVGDSPDVTQSHIKQFKKYMEDTGNWAYMATHKGKRAYSPDFIPSKKKVDPFAAARRKPGKSTSKVVTESSLKGRKGTTMTKKGKKPPYPKRGSFATETAYDAAVRKWELEWGKK